MRKQQAGSLVLVLPLDRPAPPGTLLHVYADHGDGFHEQPTLGTVTRDGLHAVLAADGASVYALAADAQRLGAGAVPTDPVLGDSLEEKAFENLVATLREFEEDLLADLLASLGAEASSIWGLGWIEDSLPG